MCLVLCISVHKKYKVGMSKHLLFVLSVELPDTSNTVFGATNDQHFSLTKQESHALRLTELSRQGQRKGRPDGVGYPGVLCWQGRLRGLVWHGNLG